MRMAMRESFTEDEWLRVVRSPLVASLAITAADPSGLIGTVQEATSTSRAMLAARDDDGTLAAEVVAAFQDDETRKAAREGMSLMVRGKKPGEASAEAVRELAAVAATVRANAPAEAAAFAAWLKEIARRAAEAASEGGFLGIGGEQVSDAERKTLADIDAALTTGMV
jgi:hypothetical protein